MKNIKLANDLAQAVDKYHKNGKGEEQPAKEPIEPKEEAEHEDGGSIKDHICADCNSKLHSLGLLKDKAKESKA